MNIPNGYDENGERAGNGSWLDYECPECGSNDVFLNGSDELICNNCGYEEGDNLLDDDIDDLDINESTFNARYFDEENNKWSDWKTVKVM